MGAKEQILHLSGKYAKPVFGYALKHTSDRKEAEDLTQDIMLELVKSIESGVNIEKLESYVWTVARHTWINWMEKNSNDQEIALDGMYNFFPDTSFEPMDSILDKEAKEILKRK